MKDIIIKPIPAPGRILVSVLTAYMFLVSCTKSEQPDVATEIPVVQTLGIASVRHSSALCAVNIKDKQGVVVEKRGVCWSTSDGPVYDDFRTDNGTGPGQFTAILEGLIPNTIYHVRAYATNVLGIGYGEELIFKTQPLLSIGDTYQGGRVGYLLKSGDAGYNPDVIHGLIVAPAEALPNSYYWYNGKNGNTGGNGSSTGTGYQNTISIVSYLGNGTYAAKACYDLVYGGYDDWFLPSIEELYSILLNKDLIGGITTNGSFWSSTELGEFGTVYGCDIYNNNVSVFRASKSWVARVRAVGAF
jgi:hypothetical protein